MAPINRLASPAIRFLSQTPRQTLLRNSTQRNFSILPRVRSTLRSFEPHPFERYPKTVQAAKADWSKQVRRLGGSAMFFFPGMGLVLGWPVLAGMALDGHMGQL